MKFTKKNLSMLLGCIVCSAVLSAAGTANSYAKEIPVSEPLFVYGTIHKDNGRLTMKNIHGDTAMDELVLNVSEETKILDAVNGFPVAVEDLREGEGVYAYISHAMTLSLPPQSYASMIVCQVPADFAAPIYETVESLTPNADGTMLLSTVRGNQYTIDGNTAFSPYLTRNIATVADLTVGRSCLVWRAGYTDTASKVVVFAPDSSNGGIGGQSAAGPASDPALIVAQ